MWCGVMLCYVMLCYVMICYVMLWYVMLWYDMLCYVIGVAVHCIVLVCWLCFSYSSCYMLVFNHVMSYQCVRCCQISLSQSIHHMWWVVIPYYIVIAYTFSIRSACVASFVGIISLGYTKLCVIGVSLHCIVLVCWLCFSYSSCYILVFNHVMSYQCVRCVKLV